MASRLPLSIERRIQSDRWSPLRRRYAHWRALGWKLALWRLLWLPFSLGGEVPAPWLPERSSDGRLAPSSAAKEAIRAIDAIRRRVWVNMVLACVARGLWLPFVGGIAVALVQLLRDRDWSPERFVWVWAVTIPLGIVLALLQRPSRWRTAWMLDRTFNLRDRMTTAIEAVEQPAPDIKTGAPMNYLQLADAANVAIGLRGDPRFRVHLPAREAVLAILTGLLLMALLFLRGVGGSLPDLSDPSVPAFVPASERRTAAGSTDSPADPNAQPPTVAQVQAQADKSNSTRDDLNAVADALDQNALTQPAADAIRNGDYATAGQSLRDVAQQADDMSPQAQSDLANALDQAASETNSTTPGLSNSASNAADGLREGGDAAEEGLRDLGDAVDLAGDSVVPQEQLASDMAQAQENAGSQAQGADSSSAAQNAPQSDQQSSSSSGNPQPSNNASNPSGADAAPGQVSDSQQQPQSDASGDQGSQSDSQAPGEQAAESDSSSSQAGNQGAQPGQSNGGQSDSAGNSEQGQAQGQGNSDTQGPSAGAPNPSSDGSTSENSSSGEAGGAGGNQTQPGAEATRQAGGTGSGESGESTDAPPTATSVTAEPTASSAGTQPTVVPNQSVTLDGDGGESIQLGGGGSASSLGSGAGVMVAGGDATQEAVPTAAPDDNRVPEEYRRIVEQYFSRDGD